MPSRDTFDDEDDLFGREPASRRARQRTNPVLIIGLVVGGLLLLGLVGCGGLMFLFRQAGPPMKPAGADAAVIEPEGGKEGPRRIYKRDEFRGLVLHKNPAEVIAAVGRPDGTDDTPDGKPRTWYYWSRVLNPATGKPDSGILDFDGDRTVVRVRW